VGTAVIILGNNLNAAPALPSWHRGCVQGDIEHGITTTVPGRNHGTVEVTTPGGSLTSNAPSRVDAGGAVADPSPGSLTLAIRCWHNTHRSGHADQPWSGTLTINNIASMEICPEQQLQRSLGRAVRARLTLLHGLPRRCAAAYWHHRQRRLGHATAAVELTGLAPARLRWHTDFLPWLQAPCARADGGDP